MTRKIGFVFTAQGPEEHEAREAHERRPLKPLRSAGKHMVRELDGAGPDEILAAIVAAQDTISEIEIEGEDESSGVAAWDDAWDEQQAAIEAARTWLEGVPCHDCCDTCHVLGHALDRVIRADERRKAAPDACWEEWDEAFRDTVFAAGEILQLVGQVMSENLPVRGERMLIPDSQPIAA
jgi:hypothetical protein